tara:strand:- start:353 stop:733 length:381 start_codon:yes stop_codon:yes gene_type:complete
MGRYYSGDIEGKFLFGVQESNDADFFGTKGQPEDIIYDFGENQIDEIKAGIKTCYEKLGQAKEGLDSYFDDNDMFNDEEIAKYFLNKYNEKINVPKSLKWYARLKLGEQIKNCVEEKGYCYFRAEL